ncbi:hypothetical protein K1T71_003253 [Dendrolimus kikuchii]|uniref:Uncharacterized protein n=1 Tax=Dendrolimus kikuchii TaxID=765133 RepID=A0ACC1DC36_9NEOP|nr:hypothetical protein K1T71_003253 [Dendrolimus kikuchii]
MSCSTFYEIVSMGGPDEYAAACGFKIGFVCWPLCGLSPRGDHHAAALFFYPRYMCKHIIASLPRHIKRSLHVETSPNHGNYNNVQNYLQQEPDELSY